EHAEVQEDANINIRTSDDTEVLLKEQELTELVEDQGSGEKGEKEVTTPVILQTYIRRSRGVSTVSRLDSTAAEIGSTAGIKAKDKGKEIMTEPKPKKKSKKQLEQERLRHEEAVRLQEQMDDEERQQIAKDAEIAKQLQEDIHGASQEQEKLIVVAEADPTKVID
ncbi:hypothetical protein Tco_0114440, partial [Tanacetum coccineum]